MCLCVLNCHHYTKRKAKCWKLESKLVTSLFITLMFTGSDRFPHGAWQSLRLQSLVLQRFLGGLTNIYSLLAGLDRHYHLTLI